MLHLGPNINYATHAAIEEGRGRERVGQRNSKISCALNVWLKKKSSGEAKKPPHA